MAAMAPTDHAWLRGVLTSGGGNIGGHPTVQLEPRPTLIDGVRHRCAHRFSLGTGAS
jgi:hypothetical protein